MHQNEGVYLKLKANDDGTYSNKAIFLPTDPHVALDSGLESGPDNTTISCTGPCAAASEVNSACDVSSTCDVNSTCDVSSTCDVWSCCGKLCELCEFC
jgi:hypothetical protein